MYAADACWSAENVATCHASYASCASYASYASFLLEGQKQQRRRYAHQPLPCFNNACAARRHGRKASCPAMPTSLRPRKAWLEKQSEEVEWLCSLCESVYREGPRGKVQWSISTDSSPIDQSTRRERCWLKVDKYRQLRSPLVIR